MGSLLVISRDTSISDVTTSSVCTQVAVPSGNMTQMRSNIAYATGVYGLDIFTPMARMVCIPRLHWKDLIQPSYLCTASIVGDKQSACIGYLLETMAKCVCLLDSISHGSIKFNRQSMLRLRLKSYSFETGSIWELLIVETSLCSIKLRHSMFDMDAEQILGLPWLCYFSVEYSWTAKVW